MLLYCTVLFLLCFILHLRAISKCTPLGAYIWRSDLMEGLLHHKLAGFILGGAYTERSLFSEFYGIQQMRLE